MQTTTKTGLLPWLITLSLSGLAACAAAPAAMEGPCDPQEGSVENTAVTAPPQGEDHVETMADRVARFAPVELGVPETRIAASHRPVLAELVRAADLMDAIFLRQVAEENPQWRAELAAQPGAADTLAYFDIMAGPWDRLHDFAPFWGNQVRPDGAAFYPPDLTAAEFSAHLAAHPEHTEAFTSYFTVIRREGDTLVARPYSEHYRPFLDAAGQHLRAAAALTQDQRLATYLEARADAFQSNSYRASDMDWMDLGDGDLEVVIGPYEVYEDGLFGYKAAFQSFIGLRDPKMSDELARLTERLPELEQALPIDDSLKQTTFADDAPISVVDLLYSSGDARAGVQTLAFILPNDQVVRDEKGAKKVMLRNVSHAKYDNILRPIADAMMVPEQAAQVSFNAFFHHTLLHETAHGLGPRYVTGQPEVNINQALKDLYAVIEETKADVVGLYLTRYLVDVGFYPEMNADEIYASFLGGFFRSVRFGASGAHGRANMIQFNFFREHGAIERDDQGRYRVVADKMKTATEALAHQVLMLEANGDYDAARDFIARYGEMGEDLQAALARLSHIPTDIRPHYAITAQMRDW